MPELSWEKTSWLRCYFFSCRVDCVSKNHTLPGNSASNLAALRSSLTRCLEISTKVDVISTEQRHRERAGIELQTRG